MHHHLEEETYQIIIFDGQGGSMAEEISVPVGMTILYHFFNTFTAHDVANLAQVTSCFSRTNLRHVTEVVRESSKKQLKFNEFLKRFEPGSFLYPCNL